jgi:hypothetical protein
MRGERPAIALGVEDPDQIMGETRTQGASSTYYRRETVANRRFRPLLLAVAVDWQRKGEGSVATAYVTATPLTRGSLEWVRSRPR